MELNYEWSLDKANIKVKLDNKIVGTIKSVIGGWQYFPKGKKEGGKVFLTISQVQKSLEHGTN
jgi:hypothetical protein